MAGHGIRRVRPAARPMDVNSAFRRTFHVVSPIFLSYFILPETLGDGITRTGVALLFVGTAACIEIARIALGIKLPGMRSYEGQRVSAYFQGLVGVGAALFLVPHPRNAPPAFLG